MKTKITLGIVTVLPLVYCIVFLCICFSALFADCKPSPEFMRAIVLAHFLCMFLMGGLLIFYLRNVYRNQSLSAEQKTLWMVILLFGNAIAMPVYWYHYVFRSAVLPRNE